MFSKMKTLVDKLDTTKGILDLDTRIESQNKIDEYLNLIGRLISDKLADHIYDGIVTVHLNPNYTGPGLSFIVKLPFEPVPLKYDAFFEGEKDERALVITPCLHWANPEIVYVINEVLD